MMWPTPRPGTPLTLRKPRPSQPFQAPYSPRASASQKSSALDPETPARSTKPKRTMRTVLPWVTRSSPPLETQVQPSAPALPWVTSPRLTCTTQLSPGLRDCLTMQLEPLRHARPPHPSHAPRDSPPTMAPASSAVQSHQTAYLTGMVANRSGMSLNSVPLLAELQACSSASHHTKAA